MTARLPTRMTALIRSAAAATFGEGGSLHREVRASTTWGPGGRPSRSQTQTCVVTIGNGN